MANNGDIISFIKQRDYIMVNNQLGSGSFGKTVLLKDPFIDELFVSKKYSPEYPEYQQAFFQSFLQEIKILYKLNHRNIVRIYNYYAYEHLYTGFILMEYIEGCNIKEHFDSYLPWEDNGSPDSVFLQLIDGFQFIEENAIVHRDIRPGNILIDKSGTVKIIDFGLGKVFKPVAISDDSMVDIINRSGLDKLPNEYFQGTYDSKTDMFYLGEMFNRLLRDSNNGSLFSYYPIITKMMEVDPENRYSSFKEISEAIGKTDFTTMSITPQDKRIYQSFSNAIYKHLSSFIGEKKFNRSVIELERNIEDILRKNCFETYIQDNGELIQAIVISGFRYDPNTDVTVNSVNSFWEWFRALTIRSKQLVLNNIISKISTIDEENDESELPF